MQIKITKNLGNTQFEVVVEEKDEKEAIARSTFYLAPDYCGLCKKNNIVWTSNKAKTDDGTFTYVKRKCLGCGGTSTAGEYKEGGLFWKNWEPAFIQGTGATAPTAPKRIEYPENNLGEQAF